MLRAFVNDDLADEVRLKPGERILYVVRRHPVMLLLRLLPPVLLLLLAGGLAWFRTVGGRFFVADATNLLQWTLLDGLLLLLVLALLAGWRTMDRRVEQVRRGRHGLMALALALLLLLGFRMLGGRMFVIESAASRPMDGFNIVLLLLALASAVAAVYTYVDWKNDQLILTNQRILSDNDQPLVQRVQEQLPVTAVQNVLARTNSYLGHWFGFGTITVQSATASHRIEFRAAQNPFEAQSRMMQEVRRLRKEYSVAELQRLLSNTVFERRPMPTRAMPRVERVAWRRGPLRRWLPTNPELDATSETYTWRRHWLFLVRALLTPVATLVVALLLVLGGAEAGLLTGAAYIGLLALVLLLFLGWAVWVVEDYLNDRYVLSPQSVVDVEKKPFGPESRRSARLDRLQNVYFRTTLLGQFLGYGDVWLETAGSGGAFTFFGVPDPRGVVATINEYQTVFRQREKDKDLEATLTLLRQYHAAVEQAAA
ncbi:MAG: PH domain-containing protein [Chloroflexaceae bacterium]|nr:PH domain-containing protein [Chloroflexaceae bacterium]